MGFDGLAEELQTAITDGVEFGPPSPPEQTYEVPGEILRDILLGWEGNGSERGMLWLRNTTISGALNLEAGDVRARVRCVNCRFVAPVCFDQVEAPNLALVDCEFEHRLYARQLKVHWNLDLSGSRLNGGLSLVGSHLGGQFSMKHATVNLQSDGSTMAVEAHDLKVDGIAYLDGLAADGEVNLHRARIAGQLSMVGAQLNGSKEGEQGVIALCADRIEVGGGLIVAGCHANGEVRLAGATVAGQIVLNGATLTAGWAEGGTHTALNAEHIKVRGGLFCDHAEINGETWLKQATVHGQLSLAGTSMIVPESKKDPRSIDADGLDVRGSLFCDGLRATGGVWLLGARVKGQVAFNGVEFASGRGVEDFAVVLATATLGELMFMPARVEGIVDLRNASVRSFWDSANGEFVGALPETFRLEGLSYRSLREPLDAEKRLKWIARSQRANFAPDVYLELSAFFRRIGHDGEARKVAIAGERRARVEYPLWHPRRALGFFLWQTIGYGYRNWKAVVWLAVLIGGGWIALSSGQSTFMPLQETPPQFNTFFYTVDVTVPVLEVGQQKAWAATGWRAWLVLFLTVSGYALVTAVIAAAAGLLSRDQP